MIKKNLPLLITTSIIILIPICIGLILWSSLPEQIAIHWNAEGVADSFGSKSMAVFAHPCFLLVVHWACTLITSADPKVKNVQGKPLTLVLWICPILSLLISTIIYINALGLNLRIEIMMPLVIGALFVLIGNYIPKCKQNHTIGIKLPWTFNDSENWNKTHRFTGILWVVGGLIIMALSLLGSFVIFMSIVVVMILLPLIYSYCLYKKKNK